MRAVEGKLHKPGAFALITPYMPATWDFIKREGLVCLAYESINFAIYFWQLKGNNLGTDRKSAELLKILLGKNLKIPLFGSHHKQIVLNLK